MLALRNCYHGMSEGTMGVTAHSTWKFNVPQARTLLCACLSACNPCCPALHRLAHASGVRAVSTAANPATHQCKCEGLQWHA